MGIFDTYDRAMLDELERRYEAADATGMKQAIDLPPGKYQAYVSRSAFIENKKVYADPFDQCDHTLLIELTVIGGQYNECLVNKWYPISINGMKRLKPDLITLGCEWAGLEALERQVTGGQLLDWIVDLTATRKQKDDKVYHNVWIDRNTGNKYTPIGEVKGAPSDSGHAIGWRETPQEKLPWDD